MIEMASSIKLNPENLYKNSGATKKLREHKASKKSSSALKGKLVTNIGNSSSKKRNASGKSKKKVKIPDEIKDWKLICQYRDFSKEVNNYVEWDKFCILKKYKNDSTKLKEYMRELERLGKNRRCICKLWKQAEIFKNRLESEREAVAELCGISDENINPPTEDDTNQDYNEVKAAPIKIPWSRTKKATSKSVNYVPPKQQQRLAQPKATLVLPPKIPNLEFLVPDVGLGAKLKYSPYLEPQGTTSNLKYSKDVVADIKRKMKGNSKFLTLANSGVLEVVASYMPEERKRSQRKLSSFVSFSRPGKF